MQQNKQKKKYEKNRWNILKRTGKHIEPWWRKKEAHMRDSLSNVERGMPVWIDIEN